MDSKLVEQLTAEQANTIFKTKFNDCTLKTSNHKNHITIQVWYEEKTYGCNVPKTYVPPLKGTANVMAGSDFMQTVESYAVRSKTHTADSLRKRVLASCVMMTEKIKL